VSDTRRNRGDDDVSRPRRRGILRAFAGLPVLFCPGCAVLDSEYETESSTIVPTDGDPEDLFGRSVDLAGGLALVGAYGDDDPNGMYAGAAYLFERRGNGWSERTRFAPADGERDDFFGDSVALTDDGSTVLVGAPHDVDANRERLGAAYVFERTDGRWTEATKLVPTVGEPVGSSGAATAPPEGAPSEFGASVALSNDTALVGAYRDERPGEEDAGVAYVFERSGDGWTRSAALTPTDGDPGDHFGVSVAVMDDSILAGAYRDEDPNGEDAGAAYVFERRTGEWTETTKLVPEDGDDGDFFGGSVALADDTALVGAPDTEDPNGTGAGAAYVFDRTGSGWTERTKLVATDGETGDHFGSAVALADDGTSALVGAGDRDTNSSDAGAAYVFERTTDGWTEAVTLAPEDGGTNDHFGRALALSETTALVGAERADEPNGEDAGAAYVFDI
jgi:hypothetical protein